MTYWIPERQERERGMERVREGAEGTSRTKKRIDESLEIKLYYGEFDPGSG